MCFISVEFQPYDPVPLELDSRDFGSEQAVHRFLQELSAVSGEATSYLSSQLNNADVGQILDLELENSDLLHCGFRLQTFNNNEGQHQPQASLVRLRSHSAR